MTRLELLQLVIARARANGFEFKRWYITRLGLPWISAEAAARLLEQQRRYYALIFAHEFACTFWKPGADITFDVPASSFDRVMPDGTTRTIQRKPFIRRSTRPEAWRYHLREMALAEEPLRYLRKYLHIEDALDPESASPAASSMAADAEPVPGPTKRPSVGKGAKGDAVRKRKEPAPSPRSTRNTTPAFLLRPYPPPAPPE